MIYKYVYYCTVHIVELKKKKKTQKQIIDCITALLRQLLTIYKLLCTV